MDASGGLGLVIAVALGLGCAWLWLRSAGSREPRPSLRAGRGAAAAETLLSVVRRELERGNKQAAVAHWLALGAAGLATHADPPLAIRMATLLVDGGRRAEAAAALRCALARSGGPTALEIASRVARAAVDLDPALALDAARCALGSEELDLLERRDLERLVAKLQSRPRGDAGAAETPAEDPGAEATPAASVEPPSRPERIELGHHPRRLEVELGVPLGLDPGGLLVALLGSAEPTTLRWGAIDAIAVGAVEGLGPEPVLIVDLVAGWRCPPGVPLRIVRLRGDRFDPCKILDASGSRVDALRDLVDRLLGETGAAPLPDLRAARGRPFAGFRDLAAFEEEVLSAAEGGSGRPQGG